MKRRLVLLVVLAALITVGFHLLLSRPVARRAVPVRPSQPAPVRPVLAAASPAVAPVAQAASNTVAASAQLRSNEFDPTVNPYAAALREPGKSKRAWDAAFLKHLPQAAAGDAIRFELTGGRMAVGAIRMAQYQEGELTYLSGELTEPEPGKFFFLKPPPEGKAGKAVGVIEFPASRTAWRIEPTGPGGEPELWQRRLDEVVCLDMPRNELVVAQADEVAEGPPLRPDLEPGFVPGYNSNIVSLQSYPGSKAVLLLDFFGGYTPTWGGVAYSRPANVNNVTIRDLWKRVAEDYMPFNINVTTDLKVYQVAPASSRQRCCFTDTPVTAAGVAYVGSWNWGNDTPCWSVYTTGKSGAEVGAHEPGHTLGLSHQGSVSSTSTNEYYGGQGSGVTGWAPIMGAGYYQNVTTWAKGEYQYANNTQDELLAIATQNNNVTYRPDDTGSTLATSRCLEVYPDGSAFAEGVIERTGDTDAFQFTTSGGQVLLAANPVGDWANLAVSATLADATDAIIASNNPQSVLSAAINTNLPAGTYTFRVTGVGRNSPFLNGFSAYSSMGYYSIAGNVAGARQPTRLSLAEHATNGTVVGSVPAGSTTNLLDYAIISGNTGGTFSIDSSGALTVANNTLLDYDRLATNSMLQVQFQLFVNITNLDDPTLTETNRRVIVAVLKQGANYPIAVAGYNASVVVPCNASATIPRAVGFDIANNYAFYQAGLNANGQAAGTGNQGLPANRLVSSMVDGTTFQLGPYGSPNVLLLGYTYPRSGTLTLTTPQAYNSLVILATSANGGGLGTLVVNFADGTKSPVFSFNAQDWYNTITNVAVQGFGRIKLGQATLSASNEGWNNPNLYQTTINFAALGLNQPVSSITFTGPAGGSTLDTGIFAVSGTAMPLPAAIAQQPQSATNTVPTQGASFSVAAMGAPPLACQWYFSPNSLPGSYAPLDGQTGATLTLSPMLHAVDAGFYYVVVTNNYGAATSTVATLSVFRAPIIIRQPAPANISLLAGQKLTYSVAANAAVPVSYYWTQDGVPVGSTVLSNLTFSSLQIANSGDYAVVVSNAFGTATSSTVSLTVLPAPAYPMAQAVLADRPIAYWRLDEKSGTVAYDYVGGYNGVYNRASLGAPGYNLIDTHTSARFGYLAATFSCVNGIPIDFATSATAAFSIEAWVNGNAQTTDCGLVTKGTGAGGEQFNLDCGGGANHAFRFFVRDAAGNAHVANSTVAPNGKWHHLVGVCDQAHTNLIFYVDSTNVVQTTISPGSGILASANTVTIGSRQSGTTTYDFQFAGYMEEVAIYNFALSSNRVRAHFIAATNRPPVFLSNPFSLAAANVGQAYSGTIATNASDPNGNLLTFSKLNGPAWLNVAGDGTLAGTPAGPDAGPNSFLVNAADSFGLSASATLNLTVLAASPITVMLEQQGMNVLLSWSGGAGPYQVQTAPDLLSTNWQTFAGPLSATNLLFAPSNAASFYRVLGQ